jgi:hypothetical protein
VTKIYTMKQLTTALTILILLTGFVSSAAAQSNENIEVQKMTTEPSPLMIGQYADVRFKVTNNMNEDFENVTVRFEEEYPFSVDPDNKKSWRIASFEEGDSYEFRMQVRVDANAVQRDEELKIRVDTSDSTTNARLPVELKADDDGLVIQEVEFPTAVGSGTTTHMNVTLENTANAYFRNIELGLNPGQQTPVVVSGTSTERISSMAPDQTKTLSYTLNVDEGAENGVYTVPISLSYENEAGASISRSASTGIVIGGRPNIDIGLNNDGSINAGSTGEVNFRFVNRGEGTAKFVQIEVLDGEDYTIRSGSSVYLGDMSSDDYQTASTEIYTNDTVDSVTMPVQVTYQENGQEQTFTKDVEVDVLTEEERSLYNTSSRNPVIPIAIVLIIAGAGIYYWRKKR